MATKCRIDLTSCSDSVREFYGATFFDCVKVGERFEVVETEFNKKNIARLKDIALAKGQWGNPGDPMLVKFAALPPGTVVTFHEE